MSSAPDAEEPGGRLRPGDLAPDEERLLAALERDTGGEPVVPPEGEVPRPASGRLPDDGLTPRFTAPGDD